jgi:hypothetical protein
LQFWHLYINCEVDLYDGEPERALARFEEAWADVKRSLMLTLQLYRVSAFDLKGRIALALAARDARGRSSHVSNARKAARKLRKEKNPWADALAALIEAGGHALLEQPADAFPRLREAEQAARAAHMGLHADVASLRRAQLGQSSGDRDEAARARKAMEAQRITDADAWANVLSPGFRVDSGT